MPRCTYQCTPEHSPHSWGCHVCFIPAFPSVSLWDLRGFSSLYSSFGKLANQTKTCLLYGKWLSGFLLITMQLAVLATFRVTDIFTGGNMSREGLIDCLGYLSMALSLFHRPLNASFSFLYSSLFSIDNSINMRSCGFFFTRTRSLEDVFAHVWNKLCLKAMKCWIYGRFCLDSFLNSPLFFLHIYHKV